MMRYPVTAGDAHVRSGLAEALHAGHAAPEHAAELRLFGQFVGSWTIEWVSASSARAIGELHFGWVLGGRAVQDTWIVPGRGQPGQGEPPAAFHGTTVRFYDPVLGAWRSTWVEPVNQRVRRFIGRPEGEDIVLLSREDEPQLRWRFTDIRPDSFTWRGESSADGGMTWDLDEEMFARRVS